MLRILDRIYLGAAVPSSGGGDIPAIIEELSVTPSTSAQTITAPEWVDGYSPVKVSAVTSSIDANIQAGNIKSGVSILGVSGTAEIVDEVTATNLTGSSVAVGDKVWLEKKIIEGQVSNAQTADYNRWLSLISPDGNYLVVNSYSYNTAYGYIYPRLYNISDLSNISDTGSLTTQNSSSLNQIQFCYNSNGDLIVPFMGETVGLKSSGGYWVQNIVFGNYRAKKISHLKDNLYAINAQSGSDFWGLYLCRLDPTSGAVTQVSSKYEASGNESQTRWAVDGYFASNKYFITSPLYDSYYCQRYEITDEANLTATYSNAGYLFYGQMLGTEDNAYTMNCNAQTNTFHVYNPTSSSMPSALSEFSGDNCWVAYNKKNKLLTIVQWNSLNYGLFKYENGSFTELDYNLLENVDTTNKVFGGYITASEDLSRFSFALGGTNSDLSKFGYNSTFTPYVVEFLQSGNAWKAYAFNTQTIKEGMFTGFSKEAGAEGSNIAVKTVLPGEVDVTLTIDQNDAEVIVE